MRSNSAVIFIALIIGALLTQFTNCDSYTDPGDGSSTSFSVCLADPDLEECKPSEKMLELQINSDTDILVPDYALEFNVGGDCNEGGYSGNQILWDLSPSGGGGILAAGSVSGGCENGRFNIEGSFRSIASYQSYSAFQLSVEVVGVDDRGSQIRNSVAAKKNIEVRRVAP